MHRHGNLFLMAGREFSQNNANESPNIAKLSPDKHQCWTEKYCKITSREDYISPYPFPIMNLLYVMNKVEKLYVEMIPDKNVRYIEQETDVVEGDMREVLPGDIMSTKKRYSSVLNSQVNVGDRQLQPEIKVDKSSADVIHAENVKVYDVKDVQNYISQIIPKQHRSKSFEKFKMLLDYLPFYMSRVEPYVNVTETFPFLHQLVKTGKYRLLNIQM